MGSSYRSRHELVLVFKNGSGKHRNNVQLGQFGRNRTNVWEYAGGTTLGGRKTDEGNLQDLHPTVKPVQMVLDAILDCTARGEIVLDPFLGSGSTLIAAERAGRRCFGLDIDPKYVDVAIRRWQHPRFNSSLDQDELILKKYVHVGFAVETLEGLVVPVIRDCDKKGLLEIATEMRALADRAIEGILSADDMRADAFRFRLSAASADIVLRR